MRDNYKQLSIWDYLSQQQKNDILTPDEFENKMKAIVFNNDYGIDDCHIEMDSLMCSLLESLGYQKGIEIFCSTEKWYS